MSKFCWAYQSYGAEPNLDTFCTYFELQRQPKKVGAQGLVAQYGSCAFMAKRQQGKSRLEISYCQKNKWDKDWMRYWFYIQTFDVTFTHEDGKKITRYPLASVMTEMKPLAKVTPSEEMMPHREACNKAFVLACLYSGCRGLVEEIVAAKF